MYNFNLNSGYGMMLAHQIAASVGPIFGKVHVVISASDEQYKINILRELFVPDCNGRVRFFTSLDDAYAACTSNADDIILLAGYATHSITTPWTWSKSRIHVIGMDGGKRLIQQGAKIDYTGAGAYTATIYVTGTRNTFENLKITNQGTHASSVAGMIDAGEGTRITNCSIQKLTDLNQTAVADFICWADSPTYEDVEFGFDTLTQTAARPTFWLSGTAAAGTRAKNIRMRNCRFISQSTSASKVHFQADADSFYFSNICENPVFINTIVTSTSAVQATVAAQSNAGTVEGTFLFTSPHVQSASFCTASTSFVVTMTPTSTTNAFEGKTPA